MKLIWLLPLIATAPTLSASVLYNVVDLTPGGSFSNVTGLNNNGEVVGNLSSAVGTGRPFIYSGGRLIDIGDGIGVAQAVNDSGQVVGAAGGRAVMYDHGTVTDLGTPKSGYVGSVAIAVNNTGQVTGYLATTLPFADYHTFLYSDGRMTDLGTFPNSHYSVGYAIDGQGRIAGQYGGTNPSHSFLYSNGILTDIGGLGGHMAFAYGMNGLGHITGASRIASPNFVNHGFLYIDGHMTDIGSFGGIDCSGRGINDLDQIVGPCRLPMSTDYHAFLYSGGTMQDLNTLIDPALGVTLENGVSINNNGYIAANGFTASGLQHGYLLVPVPELGTRWLAGIVLACAFAVSRRRAQARCSRHHVESINSNRNRGAVEPGR